MYANSVVTKQTKLEMQRTSDMNAHQITADALLPEVVAPVNATHPIKGDNLADLPSRVHRKATIRLRNVGFKEPNWGCAKRFPKV